MPSKKKKLSIWNLIVALAFEENIEYTGTNDVILFWKKYRTDYRLPDKEIFLPLIGMKAAGLRSN